MELSIIFILLKINLTIRCIIFEPYSFIKRRTCDAKRDIFSKIRFQNINYAIRLLHTLHKIFSRPSCEGPCLFKKIFLNHPVLEFKTEVFGAKKADHGA